MTKTTQYSHYWPDTTPTTYSPHSHPEPWTYIKRVNKTKRISWQQPTKTSSSQSTLNSTLYNKDHSQKNQHKTTNVTSHIPLSIGQSQLVDTYIWTTTRKTRINTRRNRSTPKITKRYLPTIRQNHHSHIQGQWICKTPYWTKIPQHKNSHWLLLQTRHTVAPSTWIHSDRSLQLN